MFTVSLKLDDSFNGTISYEAHPQFVKMCHRTGNCFVVSAAFPEAASHNPATSTSACSLRH